MVCFRQTLLNYMPLNISLLYMIQILFRTVYRTVYITLHFIKRNFGFLRISKIFTSRKAKLVFQTFQRPHTRHKSANVNFNYTCISIPPTTYSRCPYITPPPPPSSHITFARKIDRVYDVYKTPIS